MTKRLYLTRLQSMQEYLKNGLVNGEWIEPEFYLCKRCGSEIPLHETQCQCELDEENM